MMDIDEGDKFVGVLDLHSSRPTDSVKIIAHQVDDHVKFGQILFAGL